MFLIAELHAHLEGDGGLVGLVRGEEELQLHGTLGIGNPRSCPRCEQRLPSFPDH